MLVHRSDTRHRSAGNIPFVQEGAALESVALRHLTMALSGAAPAARNARNKASKKKAGIEEGGNFMASDAYHEFWTVRV